MIVKMSGKCYPQWNTWLSLLSLFCFPVWGSLSWFPDGRINILQIILLDEASSAPIFSLIVGPSSPGKSFSGRETEEREGPPPLPNSGSPHIQCFNCSGKNEAFISHSIFKKKISCDILIPFCAGAFLELSPASHLECFVSFPFSWIAYYKLLLIIKNYVVVIEWQSRSLGYSGPWVSIQLLISESSKTLTSCSSFQENKNWAMKWQWPPVISNLVYVSVKYFL